MLLIILASFFGIIGAITPDNSVDDINKIGHRVDALQNLVTQLNIKLETQNSIIQELQAKLSIIETSIEEKNDHIYPKYPHSSPPCPPMFHSDGMGQDINDDVPTDCHPLEQIPLPSLEERIEKLESLAKVGTLRSCEEYANFGVRTNGKYNIDPDGPLVGEPPFEVFCNFDNGAITEVLHDTEVDTLVDFDRGS